MNIVPTRIQEQVGRVDRNHALVIGILAGVTALWSIYRVFWLVYSAAMYSSVGWSPVSLVFPLVWWGVVAVGSGCDCRHLPAPIRQATLKPRVNPEGPQTPAAPFGVKSPSFVA